MIVNFDKFIKDVEKHHGELLSSDWPSIEKEYSTYLKDCYPKFKQDMSTTERVNFWKNALSYGIHRSISDNNFDFDLENYGIKISEEVDALSNLGKEELEDFIKEEFGPKLEKSVNDILEEVNGVGDAIKGWLERN